MFFTLGLAGLLMPLILLLFLVQVMVWMLGSRVIITDLLRSLLVKLAVLDPLKQPINCLALALLSFAAAFYYGVAYQSPQWIIAAGTFFVFFGHIGDKFLTKAAAPDCSIKESLDLLLSALIGFGTLWTGLSVWYLKDLPPFA